MGRAALLRSGTPSFLQDTAGRGEGHASAGEPKPPRGSVRGPGEARRPPAWPGDPCATGSSPGFPRPLTERAGLAPARFLTSSCPPVEAGGGNQSRFASARLCRLVPALAAQLPLAHVLATARPEPVSPEPGTGALLSQQQPRASPVPARPATCLPLSQQPSPARGNGRHLAHALPSAPCPGRRCPSTSLLPGGRQGERGAPGVGTSPP